MGYLNKKAKNIMQKKNFIEFEDIKWCKLYRKNKKYEFDINNIEKTENMADRRNRTHNMRQKIMNNIKKTEEKKSKEKRKKITKKNSVEKEINYIERYVFILRIKINLEISKVIFTKSKQWQKWCRLIYKIQGRKAIKNNEN